ncbi:MAG: hypothetical protein EBS23_00865 [Betaproteobacteria bacterium]|nr:hypothetical protein [Betaproteobacteria bacterium]
MPQHTHDLSPWTVDAALESVGRTIPGTPRYLRPIGRSIANALELYLEASLLANWGDLDQSIQTLHLCQRHVADALRQFERVDVSARADFTIVAARPPMH